MDQNIFRIRNEKRRIEKNGQIKYRIQKYKARSILKSQQWAEQVKVIINWPKKTEKKRIMVKNLLRKPLCI